MARVDVTIRGAGIFGLSIAWTCVQRGARVRVVDPHGAGSGASGGIVGALAPHVPENWNEKKAFQLESLLMAARFWAGIEAAGGQPSGYARSGRLQPIADTRALELAQTRAATARALWGDAAEWRVIDRAEADRWAPTSVTGRLVQDTLSARIHPRMACTALVAALRAHGTEISRDAPTQDIEIWATGVAGLQELNGRNGRSVGAGIKGQAALLRYDAGHLPQIFADGLHVVPHADGTVAIGSTTERDWTDPTATDTALNPLIDQARAAVPALAGAPVIERWAGLRPRARSRAPMLGPHPTKPGQFIANGGFKIGFGMAPKVAQVMADLVLDARDAIPDGFRPDASMPRHQGA
ncbi:MAG: FAD-dependent oxidoreductase [Pseudomonadota bacterium]